MIRTPTPSIFRPAKPIDQSVLKENRALLEDINRRNVLRGTLSGLPVGPEAGDEVCLSDDIVGTDFTDAEFPDQGGGGFWYLVRGVSSCSGAGPYGFQGFHGSQGVPEVSATCP